MLQLSRIVRFAINPPGVPAEPGFNGYAGSPPIRGLGRHYELRILCAGEADPATGYLIDIKDIDRAVRTRIIPIIERACAERPATDPGALLGELIAPLREDLGPQLHSLRWNLSPYYCVEMSAADTSCVLLRQKFDFSASHRLHIPELSDEENRRRFGKCNNPSGHGHNYQFEPCVALRSTGLRPVSPPATPGQRPESEPFTLATLERLSFDTLIRRFDHKNLTTDCPEFQVGPSGGGGGLNATVENIAKVFYTILADAIQQATPTAMLRSITVWETDRTSATYPE